jgi:hypothetical protein
MAARGSFEDFYAATVDRLLGHLFLVNFWAGLFLETGSPPPGGQMPELAVDRILAFDQAGKQVAACRACLGAGSTCQL